MSDEATLRQLAHDCGAEEYLYGRTPPILVVEFTLEKLTAYTERIRAEERERIIAALKDWDCIIDDAASAENFAAAIRTPSSSEATEGRTQG